jgi:hypothetical protein
MLSSMSEQTREQQWLNKIDGYHIRLYTRQWYQIRARNFGNPYYDRVRAKAAELYVGYQKMALGQISWLIHVGYVRLLVPTCVIAGY